MGVCVEGGGGERETGTETETKADSLADTRIKNWFNKTQWTKNYSGFTVKLIKRAY